jgi:hypothetical protein
MPAHVMKALQKYSPQDSLQIMSASQTSDILHNNVSLIEQLRPAQKIELLRYLIKEPTTSSGVTQTTSNIGGVSATWPSSAARNILDLPLLQLSNQKFIRFQSVNKTKPIHLVENDFLILFNNNDINNSTSSSSNQMFINPDLPKDLLQIFKKYELQRKFFLNYF